MAAHRRTLSADHPVVITFLIFAVIGFMWLAGEVLKPLALAVLLSFALSPVAGFLERRGVPRFLSVVLTILLTLSALGAIGYEVGQQLTTLTKDLPQYEENIKRKLSTARFSEGSSLDRLSKVSREVAASLDKPEKHEGVTPVSIVSQPSFTERLRSAVGPYLEYLGVASFVLILVLFILSGREELSDRIIRLFGASRVSLTTRTMEEAAQRISRYLGMFSLVNSVFGLIITLGLWAIGVRFAILWGVLFALLRFIPYVGPAVAFALPLAFSFADAPGWREPLMVVALFATLETLANSFLEPLIYGKTTGVSALGLLVAAMFWTWLWGALGLLLSTPLTVCLAVLGKSVSGLRAFAILLTEDVPLEPDVRFYQRLLAMDQEGAAEIVEAALAKQPRDQVFDEVLVPALARAERDHVREEIDDRERTFIWRVVSDLVIELEESPVLDLQTLSTAAEARAVKQEEEKKAASPERAASGSESDTDEEKVPAFHVLGVAVNDEADILVLRMLNQLLTGSGCVLTILPPPESPLKLVEQVAEADPELVLLSHLPPAGFTAARYLVRRLRARFAELPIVVARWRFGGDTEGATEKLSKAGPSKVVFRLSEARDLILEKAKAHVIAQTQPRADQVALKA